MAKMVTKMVQMTNDANETTTTIIIMATNTATTITTAVPTEASPQVLSEEEVDPCVHVCV